MIRPALGSCAGLLRDVSRRITHQLNNAANGVAVNLEVVRSRAGHAEADAAQAPFVERASHQLEELTALHEVVTGLLQLTMEAVDEQRVTCRLSEDGDTFEVTFTGTDIPRVLSARGGPAAILGLRNSPQGVILSVPRNSPSSE